uniref:Uncharacterized protein n=1 Tax=Haptolina brevifila TaxID=156173 RepID=A0A7S2N2D1_9EUKA|mmetsp:Transcript_65089/g.128723  ORF Transcript_65089/g.128723 Transcript_65089/m.128723 type:complete len:101 (+) Transcript_65089:208-510(+)
MSLAVLKATLRICSLCREMTECIHRSLPTSNIDPAACTAQVCHSHRTALRAQMCSMAGDQLADEAVVFKHDDRGAIRHHNQDSGSGSVQQVAVGGDAQWL